MQRRAVRQMRRARRYPTRNDAWHFARRIEIPDIRILVSTLRPESNQASPSVPNPSDLSTSLRMLSKQRLNKENGKAMEGIKQ